MFVGEHTFLCEGIDCFGSSLISCRAAMGGNSLEKEMLSSITLFVENLVTSPTNPQLSGKWR